MERRDREHRDDEAEGDLDERRGDARHQLVEDRRHEDGGEQEQDKGECFQAMTPMRTNPSFVFHSTCSGFRKAPACTSGLKETER